MNFNITISENGKYIVGKVYGQLNKEVAEQIAKEYVKIHNSTGIKRILNDVRDVSDKMSVLEEYRHAYEDVNSLGIPRDIRAAIVVSEGDVSHNFQETVARNAGYSVKIFHSIEQAVKWLLTDNE